MNKESKCPECETDLKYDGLALIGGVVMGRYHCPDCSRTIFIERLNVMVYAERPLTAADIAKHPGMGQSYD